MKQTKIDNKNYRSSSVKDLGLNGHKLAILSGWKLFKHNDIYYIPLVHYIYIEYLVKCFDEIYLIVPIQKSCSNQTMKEINFKNIKIIELPYYNSYKDAIFLFWNFFIEIKKLKHIRNFYVRVPDPYSWMPQLLFRKRTVMHFVGDSIDVIKNNKKLSIFKKSTYILFYFPEYLLTLFAAIRAKSYSNGNHISKKLNKYGIKVTPVVSSTLVDTDFFEKRFNPEKNINLLSVGYIRHSKGIETLVKMMDILINKKKMNVYLNLIGNGEAFDNISKLVSDLNLQKHVKLHGHIDDKNLLTEFYRNSDIFVFASLSEGSPRVVLEAMANSLPVISTPVGSLPSIFSDKEEILFADFENPVHFSNMVEYAIEHSVNTEKMAKNAFLKVKTNYTRDVFLNKVFGEFYE